MSVSPYWNLANETGYTSCDTCKQIAPPIYEVVYQLRSAPPQYHYFCRPCATKHLGKEGFDAGLLKLRDRTEIRQERGKLLAKGLHKDLSASTAPDGSTVVPAKSASRKALREER